MGNPYFGVNFKIINFENAIMHDVLTQNAKYNLSRTLKIDDHYPIFGTAQTQNHKLNILMYECTLKNAI